MMRAVLMSGLMLVLAGCGVSDLTIDDSDNIDQLTGGMAGDNGRLSNGRLSNGRLANGRLANGRLANGLTVGSLSPSSRDASFDTWWNADPAGANMEMKYVVRCAVAKGVTVKYKNTSGTTFSWTGVLGLAPGWFDKYRTSVDAATLTAEQERVTGCLLGLTNSSGNSVTISASGMGITVAYSEYSSYPNDEGAFFGNVFIDSPQMFSCKRMMRSGCGLDSSCYLTRGRTCAADPASCGMTGVGGCDAACSGGLCYGNGKAYPPFSTRVAGFLGDGFCETNECGYGTMDCNNEFGPYKKCGMVQIY